MKPRFVDVRDGVLLVEFPEASDEDANRAAVRLAPRLRPGLLDAIPAARSLLLIYDPLAVDRDRLAAEAERAASAPAANEDAGRLLRLPVVYDGEDLAGVASRAGLPPGEFARRHAVARYRVAFAGFTPGFAYLSGLPAELAAPRRTTPRPRVAAGTVAIGGPWTGVYPSDSPGGWQLIGRTSAMLFDPGADPPSLLAPGDRVQFEAVSELPPRGHLPASDVPAGRPAFRVLSPGLFSTIQGAPRPGLGASGVPPGGAMDPIALAVANASVGNPPDAPALEITLAGPELEALADSIISPGRPLRAGERLRIGRVERGARSYLAVAGGFVDPRRPGESIRRLSTGDLLSAGEARPVRSTPPHTAELSDEILLRAVLGPEARVFAPEGVAQFLGTAWRVTPESDRRGLRLEGPPLAHLGDPEIAPSGTVPGTVQVPGSGLPIVLGPDGPVTGGYPRIATVIGADLWRLGQARPGAILRFAEVAFREAHSARRAGGSTITLP